MHLHILGICGTFMGGIAAIAQAAGHRVTGCDANVYPPMSTQLESLGIALTEGFGPEQLQGIARDADVFVVGNVVSRGNPLMEAILDAGFPYVSGPQWLYENVLRDLWVLAVAGTHGKTTTAAMLAWILEHAGLDPAFLIGGVPIDFGVSARRTTSRFFVIEADEYDTAFFDKRSKFVHYRPRTAILNNLEFDHADIFPDLAAIETQFHHFVRTVPSKGRLIVNGGEQSLARVLARGCWSEVERFGFAEVVGSGQTFALKGRPEARNAPPLGAAKARSAERGGPHWTIAVDGTILLGGAAQGTLVFGELGRHNQLNALSAIAAARHVGVPVRHSLEALASFRGVRRRLETRGVVRGITVYDDFAHHPTAIATTLDGLRRAVGRARIVAVLEPRSNTMKLGTMKAALADSLREADRVYCYAGNLGWDVAGALAPLDGKVEVHNDLATLTEAVARAAQPGDHVLIMSNGGFGGIHDKLLGRLSP